MWSVFSSNCVSCLVIFVRYHILHHACKISHFTKDVKFSTGQSKQIKENLIQIASGSFIIETDFSFKFDNSSEISSADDRPKFSKYFKKILNSNFYCHIWIQLEKYIKMSTNKLSIWRAQFQKAITPLFAKLSYRYQCVLLPH